MNSVDIIDEIDDLILQATTEKSHYYTASVLRSARMEILDLRSRLLAEQAKNDPAQTIG